MQWTTLAKQAVKLGRKVNTLQAQARPNLARYRDRPVEYMREVLKVRPWSVQEQIARLIRTPPYRVMVKASHSVGKTWLAAALTSHWFDTGGPGSVAITTAPTKRDVEDLLWAEIRKQRRVAGLGGFIGDSAPVLWAGHDHYAKGFTAETGESFQGRHFERMLFIFDEAVGIPSVFWQTVKTMFKPNGQHGWIAIFNPTDTASEAYQQELAGGWHVVEMSSYDHPNLAVGVDQSRLPYPAAVDVSQFEDWLRDWSEPIATEDAEATDIEWPRGSGQWFRPGPQMEARALGRWPSQATYGVWSDSLWKAATLTFPFSPDPAVLPRIGCDPARFGTNYTAIHARWVNTSIHHERHNGWSLDRTAGRLKQLCREYAKRVNDLAHPNAKKIEPEQIPVHLDVNGLGAGVMDMRGDFKFIPVDCLGQSNNPNEYPNVRSELWFGLQSLARVRAAHFHLLSKATQAVLRRQAMAVEWKVNLRGQKQVERKEETAKRLNSGSPDDMDAANLAYYEPPIATVSSVFAPPAKSNREGPSSMTQRQQRTQGPRR